MKYIIFLIPIFLLLFIIEDVLCVETTTTPPFKPKISIPTRIVRRPKPKPTTTIKQERTIFDYLILVPIPILFFIFFYLYKKWNEKVIESYFR